LLNAYENQEYPFEELLNKLNIKISPARNPMFDTMLVFHNELMNDEKSQLKGIKISPYDMKRSTSSKIDFKLDIFLGKESLLGSLEYNTNLFTKETMLKFVNHFKLICKQVGIYEK
jgi:non-ribosomal peptide synthetase component F